MKNIDKLNKINIINYFYINYFYIINFYITADEDFV